MTVARVSSPEPRSVSLWSHTLPAGASVERPPLDGDTDVDVAIIGAGYTGLWTARSLLEHDPHLRVVILEAEQVGFGASGRNGGWCSALLPMATSSVAARSGLEASRRLQRAMNDTVAEVGRAITDDGIDCDWAHGGTVTLARSAPQWERLRRQVAEAHAHGATEGDLRLLAADEARAMCAATNVVGGAFTPHCAAVHPARLAHGLARAVERRGARIVERTRATRLAPGHVTTSHGQVRAEVVVLATEAFTPRLPGHRRSVAPIYSLMVATEPLDAATWAEIGLGRRQTFHDERHLVIYGQRTADDRIAFGGRGARYHWGSRLDVAFEVDRRVHDMVGAGLVELFPALGEVEITHRWGGAVAAPRDWWAHVALDRRSGIASAGGYVGDGVGASNLAGRTLADMICGADSDLVDLPWVGHRSPAWEPEPLRWLGINAAVQLPAGADRHEMRHGRVSRWREALLGRLLAR